MKNVSMEEISLRISYKQRLIVSVADRELFSEYILGIEAAKVW